MNEVEIKTVPIYVWNDYSEVPISGLKEDDKIECHSCDKLTEEEKKKCDFCDGRGWNHIDMEWSFSCSCWAEECMANCPENVYIDCECYDD